VAAGPDNADLSQFLAASADFSGYDLFDQVKGDDPGFARW